MTYKFSRNVDGTLKVTTPEYTTTLDREFEDSLIEYLGYSPKYVLVGEGPEILATFNHRPREEELDEFTGNIDLLEAPAVRHNHDFREFPNIFLSEGVDIITKDSGISITGEIPFSALPRVQSALESIGLFQTLKEDAE